MTNVANEVAIRAAYDAYMTGDIEALLAYLLARSRVDLSRSQRRESRPKGLPRPG